MSKLPLFFFVTLRLCVYPAESRCASNARGKFIFIISNAHNLLLGYGANINLFVSRQILTV